MEEKNSDNYSEVELTEEEEQAAIAFALREARKKKAAIIREHEYSKKLVQVPTYAKFTYESLKQKVLTEHPNFVLDEFNVEIFDELCLYFSGDERFEKRQGRTFQKGILLYGPVGCGKTSLMRMFSKNSFRPFSVIACRKIADYYSADGEDALYTYSNPQPEYPQRNFGLDYLGRCFDDLGTEEEKRRFGNRTNVMQDIIYKIYDAKLHGHFHLTTNLTGDDIENEYGFRIRSRVREMFNVLRFNTESPDRRV